MKPVTAAPCGNYRIIAIPKLSIGATRLLGPLLHIFRSVMFIDGRHQLRLVVWLVQLLLSKVSQAAQLEHQLYLLLFFLLLILRCFAYLPYMKTNEQMISTIKKLMQIEIHRYIHGHSELYGCDKTKRKSTIDRFHQILKTPPKTWRGHKQLRLLAESTIVEGSLHSFREL